MCIRPSLRSFPRHFGVTVSGRLGDPSRPGKNKQTTATPSRLVGSPDWVGNIAVIGMYSMGRRKCFRRILSPHSKGPSIEITVGVTLGHIFLSPLVEGSSVHRGARSLQVTRQ